ncbi:iron-containing alcohol dehydrogenase [Dethiosulfatarculus sandiegensis]|uniref:Alcohol dehydrogenase n=1 Tax=Dethiosulfatarculus sandiegensis TaxID=1429043 RepID=A0A0D2JX52_9BACT|nr:iron-containing alcohol dehydrogenase [Dethiosulfatarculus sandiegensis]KIX14160.1 alcohol dehydrogenase [Dethiosulfatarculus sandiegensis]
MVTQFTLEGVRRTIFGQGCASELGAEAKLLGAKSVLVVVDPNVLEAGVAEPALKSLEDAGLETTVFSGLTREPEPAEADEAAQAGRGAMADVVVGIGGGSALDMAKAASVLLTNPGKAVDYVGLDLVKEPGKPVICLPTTAGTGSEVTFTAVFTRRSDKFKGGINGRFLYPHTAMLDPLLTVTCPEYVTATTGIDALTHAMEAYTSLAANPISDNNALIAIALIGENLRKAVANGENLEAREGMLLGAYYAGLALAQAGVGAVHAMAYPLGAFHDVPHGEANAVLLPYVLEYNVMACPDRFADMGRALAELPDSMTERELAEACVEEVYSLGSDVGIPPTLHELKLPKDEIKAWAEKAMTVARPIANNPRKVTAEDLASLYEDAFGV